MSEVIALINQKGGVGKTTTAFNLGIGLVREGKKVLLLDTDPQCNLTQMCGHQVPDMLPSALPDVVVKTLNGEPMEPGESIIKSHKEGIHLMPANLQLSVLEQELAKLDNGPMALKQYVDQAKKDYDFVIVDSGPTLGMLSINTMTAADKLIIPVQPHFLSLKGMEQLFRSYTNIRNNTNPNLQIKGILFSMVESRAKYSHEIMELVNGEYGEHIKVFKTSIPRSIKAAEMSTANKSIFKYRSKSGVAQAYTNLAKEVIGNVRTIEKQNTIGQREPTIHDR